MSHPHKAIKGHPPESGFGYKVWGLWGLGSLGFVSSIKHLRFGHLRSGRVMPCSFGRWQHSPFSRALVDCVGHIGCRCFVMFRDPSIRSWSDRAMRYGCITRAHAHAPKHRHTHTHAHVRSHMSSVAEASSAHFTCEHSPLTWCKLQ